MFAKHNPTFLFLGILLILLSTQLASCVPFALPTTTTPDAEAIYLTVAAQTVEVLATDTPVALPTLTPTPATPTATPKSCYDSILFVADVTIPDGKQIQAGEPFTKIWRMKNNGTCTISPAYDLIFFQGDLMGAPEEQKLVNKQIPPGGTFDVTTQFVAPVEEGHYRGYWLIRDIHGIEIGLSGGESFYVDINVIPNPNGTPTSQMPSATPIPPTQDLALPSNTPVPSQTLAPTATQTPTLTATPSTEPELIIQSAVLMPQTVQNGDVVTLVLVIENIGLTTAPAFHAQWLLDPNNNQVACSLPAQSIPPKGYIVLNCAYQINQTSPGTLNTLVKIDDQNQVAEANESNNQKEIQITVVQ